MPSSTLRVDDVSITVKVEHADAFASWSRDDGRRRTPTRRARGLQGLADRVSALRRHRSGSTENRPARHDHRGGAAMRVVIADDSALLREGLARLLVESGVEVCATVARRVGARRRRRRRTGPTSPIVDIRMPPTFTHEGAVAAVALRRRYPDLGILLLSQAIETHFAAQLLERHAARFGYLLKDRVVDVSMLVQALDTIAAGGTVLDPDIVRSLMRAHARRSPVLALLRPRARRARADGRGDVQLGDRRAAGRLDQDRREPHRQHLQQARAARRTRWAPAGAGRPRGAAPRRRLTRKACTCSSTPCRCLRTKDGLTTISGEARRGSSGVRA